MASREGSYRPPLIGPAAPGRPGTVPAADAFFLHVESPVAAQHVGGLAVMDDPDGRFSRQALEDTVREHLAELPRFRQRLAGVSRWRRPRWVEVDDLDWAWHVPHRDLSAAGALDVDAGRAALDALVAELAAEPLPRDRPLWRFVAVTGVSPGRVAAILIVHHVVADGIGTVAPALTMLRPRIDLPSPAPGEPPGAWRRSVGTVAGLAQLATDGRPKLRLPRGDTARRVFTTVDLPLADVRGVARRQGTRVSDVLLATVAGAVRQILPKAENGREIGADGQSRKAGTEKRLLRVAVPLMVRPPGAAAEGNLTAAVMIDLPLDAMTERDRLRDIAHRSRPLHTGTRALASNFVMRRIGALMPVPFHAWFARTVYGGRFFQAIVSNMPGPTGRLTLAGGRLTGVYPVLPLAPGAPLAIGALGWDGTLSIGIAADPALVEDPEALAGAMREVFAELTRTPHIPAPRQSTGLPAPVLRHHPGLGG